MERVRIAATGNSPNYLPQYLAEKLGFFKDEGLDVSEVVPEPWPGVLDELGRGAADAVLGGAWLPAIFYGRGRAYKIFAQLNGRYPLALVTRESMPPGSLEWLAGKTVVVPSSGGLAAYVFFTGLLRERGFAPERVRFVRDLSHEMLGELFLGGLGDAIVTYMVNALHLVESGKGYLAVSLDSQSGMMPNSVYYTTETCLAARRDVLVAFTRALQRAMDWITANGVQGTDVRAVCEERWPDEDEGLLARVVHGFWTNQLWADGVKVDEGALSRWQRFLVDASLLTSPVPYEELVDQATIAAALQGASG